MRKDGSYIITGALGGVGMSVVRWLVDSGAGRVVLNGRSAPSDEVQSMLDELGGRAEIITVLGDVAEPGVAERLVDRRGGDRQAVAGRHPLGGRARRRARGRPHAGEPGPDLGAEGGRAPCGCTK